MVEVHWSSSLMLLAEKNGSLRRGEESGMRGEEEREDRIFFLGLAKCSSPIQDFLIKFFFLIA